MFRPLLHGVALCAIALAPASMIAQQQPTSPLVRGVVVDSANNPLKNAEVTAVDSSKAVVATVRTDKNGAFVIRTLVPGHPYVFSARQVGFARGTSNPITLRAIDTLNLRFSLDVLTATLPGVSVLGRVDRAYQIDAAEIARHSAVDALDVVLNYRTRMLGDVYKGCRPDTSHLTIRPPRASAVLPKLSNPNDTLGQTPLRVFVNGIVHDELGVKNILAQIPAEDVAEMRYVSCMDTSVPPLLRNVLFVILKPGKQY